MNPAIIISLVTLVVGSTVSLVIAALHRKQMRQIELHKEDPSVPLKPPPHPVTAFLRRTLDLWAFLFSFSINLAFLIWRLSTTTPPTRLDMLAIALFMGGMFSSALQFMILRLVDRGLSVALDAAFDAATKNLQIALHIDGNLTRVTMVVEKLIGHTIEADTATKETPEPPKKPRK